MKSNQINALPRLNKDIALPSLVYSKLIIEVKDIKVGLWRLFPSSGHLQTCTLI